MIVLPLCFTVKYLQNGKKLEDAGSFLLNENQQLHIEEVEEKHAGRYSCVAENVPGRAEKDPIVVSLLKAPVMTELSKAVEIQENGTQTLTCPVEVTDDPSTVFEWSKNGLPVSSSPNLQLSGSGRMLHIMRAQTYDSGVYDCLAQNEAGEDEASFKVIVLVPPSIQGAAFRNMESILNQTVQLHCQTSGIPQPEVDWFQDGQRVFSGLNSFEILKNGTVLRVNGIQVEHEGRYTCMATNKVGKAEADTFVQVIEMPGIKTPADQLKVVEGKEQRLECLVTGIPMPKVEWRRNGDLMDGGWGHHTSADGNSHFLHIHNINVSDAGRYSCVATNRAGETRQNIQLNVLVPPTIGDGERILKVAEGNPLALDCLAKGHPAPEIVWRKNGATISPRVKTRLLLENLTSGENGRYTCEATNEAGTATADFVVEVLVKPTMRDHTAELRVVEGERAKLECKAEGHPDPTIKWMRGGRPITDMTNLILSPRGETLMILKTKRSDGGAYSCNVKNSAGEIEAPFTVIVLTAPHIEQTIDQNPRVINNNSVVLDCPVLGHPTPEVVWFKEGQMLVHNVNVVQEGRNNLKIHRVSVSDAGRYTCLAKNEVGTLNTDYQLEVLAPPKFGAEGQRIFEVVEGDSVTISCPVEAVPLPEIEWLRGVNPIYSSENVRISEESKKLTILKSTLHDGGKYTCKATNIAGSTDIDLILKVLVPPTIDKSNLISNPLAIFGREIFLECPATGIPQPTILWTRDGMVIDVENSEQGKYSLHQSNQSFGISKIEASDQGKYICEVQNKGGRISEQFVVEVLEPPQMVSTESQKLTKREGDLLTLVCPVKNEALEADSELRITWAKDGRPLEATDSSNYEIINEGRRLQLLSSSISDAGQYKCVASNRAGQSHVKFQVEILSKPVIDGSRSEGESHVLEGHPITLWCPASGNPLPKIRWYRNGLEVGAQQKYRILDQGQGIEITKAAGEDDGLWTCEAENAAGSSQLEIPLDVWVEPKAIVRFQESGGQPIKPIGSSVTLFCNVTGNPPPAITWMLNDQIIIPSADGTRISLSGYRLDIPRLQSQDAGDYYCVAQNEVGTAKDKISVDILVPPLIDRDSVELNPRLPVGRTLTLFCDAKGEPEPVLKWFINGTLVDDSASNNYQFNVVFGDDGKFIQVPNVTLEDRAIYKCEASNTAGTDEMLYKVDIFQSPTIYKGGTEQVAEGKVAILDCNAGGEPPPLVTWQRNGVRVETGLRYVVEDKMLKIIDTRSSDSGIYVCVATNEAGTDQQAFTLEVLIPPKLVSTSANHSTIALNGNVSLKCSASGYPAPKVIWTVDEDQKPLEEQLKEGIDYLLEDGGTALHLKSVKHKGTRVFHCAVVNDAGDDEVSYSVKTISPPTITKEGVKVQKITEGEPLKLSCEVGLGMNVDYSGDVDEDETTWQKDGVNFEPDPNVQLSQNQKELSFSTVQLNHAGNYSCTVRNFAGVASQYMQIHVGVPPKIADNSRRVVVKRGGLAELWCEAVGIPTPKISWLKDNQSLQNSDVASETTSSGEMKRTAIFSDISPEQAGVYTCHAENWAGSDFMTVDLIVLIPPGIFPEKQNVTANIEETIILPCNASGIPEPVVSWVKAPHKDIIGNEGKYQILGTSLAIKKITAFDDGFYHCIAKSEAGQAIGLRRINVNLPRNSGKNIWVECDGNGQPVKSTTYVPARGDRPQTPNDYLHWDTEYQQLPENGTDGVVISCLPSHRGPRRVPVNTLPHFVETPLNTMVNPGAELRLHCSAMGSPTPAIFWLKDGQLLDEFRSLDGSSILQLQALNKSIAGQYACAARNQIGESRAFAEVSLGPGDWDVSPSSIAKLLRDRSKLRPVTVLQCFNGSQLEKRKVTWTVDGRKIGQSEESLHPLNNGSLALIYFASEEEMSAFGCKVRDQPGTVHRAGQVEVLDVLPRALIRPTRIYSHPKMDIIIDCKLKTGSALTTRVQWSKNNVNLEPDFDKFEVMPNNSLLIRTVIDSDRGSYKCRSWNSQGKSWDDVDLIIEDVPDAVVGQLSGSINGNQIQETHEKMVLAEVEPQLYSNDILMQIDNLPKNIAKSSAKATRTLVSIMSMPLTQLGYDPDGPETVVNANRNISNGPAAKFERLTEYSFQSGEKMRVKQHGDGIEQGKMKFSVDFQGSVPEIDESRFSIEPMNEDLVEESPGKMSGFGNSAVNFGKDHRVSFKWQDKITYDPNSEPDSKMMHPGSTMHIHGRPKIENDSNSVRLEIKVDRFGYCPHGYAKVRDTCRDVNECDLDEGICAPGSECKNTQGSFECERRCQSGFYASADGECIDVNECSLGLDDCDASTECYNIEGSFECIESCADGFYHNTESICEDVNECQLDDPCNPPMFCENLLGSFKCLCPAGFPIANDTCQGISMDPMNPLKTMEYSSEPEEGSCPSGFVWDSTQSVCADLDECAFDAPCQFDCTNKAGAFECSCPDGYALNEQGQCIDINECDAESACDEGEVCFNQLGEYSCIRNPCPRNYRLDHLKAQCLPRCQNCSDASINLHMLAVPKGLGVDTPLVRLSAHDKAGRVLRNTNFHIMADKMEDRGLHTNGPYHSPPSFYLKTKKGRATVHNQQRLLAGSLHKIPIKSNSMNKEGVGGHMNKYQTNFLVFVAVSKYPF